MDVSRNEVRSLTPDDFPRRKSLAHASQQARERNYQDFLIVDVDSHHYESESYEDVFSVYREPGHAPRRRWKPIQAPRPLGVPQQPGRLSGHRRPHHPARAAQASTSRATKQHRDIVMTLRMDGRDGRRLRLPVPDADAVSGPASAGRGRGRACAAPITAGSARRFSRTSRASSRCSICRSTIPRPAYRTVQDFGDKKGVVGFMVTSPRYKPVHDNAYMKTYALLEEMGKPISFHAAYNWDDQSLTTTNRFISVHALGFMWFNMVHMTNWVVNGIPERFPKLKTMWIESGPHLGLLPDAAARPFLHDAHVRLPVAQAQAERIYARDVLLARSRWRCRTIRRSWRRRSR